VGQHTATPVGNERGFALALNVQATPLGRVVSNMSDAPNPDILIEVLRKQARPGVLFAVFV
jgi:hypothetical protein